MRYLLLILVSLALVGCASTGGNNVAARSAVQYATLKVIDNDPERADRVIEIARMVKDSFDGSQTKPVTEMLEPIEQRVRDEINWQSLDAAEQVVVSNLIQTARIEIKARIDAGKLSKDQQVVVNEVLNWIIQAAGMVGGGNVDSAQTADRPPVVPVG